MAEFTTNGKVKFPRKDDEWLRDGLTNVPETDLNVFHHRPENCREIS
jgi:hypothetical protein